ncbi:helix-turn-helix transcriptional regulator [Geotalea sp. SG265]|uniref:helix-turn-helix domain-containing protein n=1 Tax=Geotalea sp. SG265 TaxID=2922867 RepID=UPI001FB0244A|nr:helix-turn-helix transcriptional regulator [Geotalea sp. SG265]
MKPRVVTVKGKPHLVIMAYSDYVELLESKGKKATFQTKIDTPEEQPPAEVHRNLKKGKSPLKAWRLYRDLTQAALAKRAGVSTATISLIENDLRPGTIDTFKALAKVLKVPAKVLMGS